MSVAALCGAATGRGAEAAVDGVPVKRDNGAWLGLAASGAGYVLSFYDAEKQPVRPDVLRATVRWRSPLKQGQQFSVLLLDTSGLRLTGNKPVQPPYVFKAILCLVNVSGEALETYTVDFSPDKARKD